MWQSRLSEWQQLAMIEVSYLAEVSFSVWLDCSAYKFCFVSSHRNATRFRHFWPTQKPAERKTTTVLRFWRGHHEKSTVTSLTFLFSCSIPGSCSTSERNAATSSPQSRPSQSSLLKSLNADFPPPSGRAESNLRPCRSDVVPQDDLLDAHFCTASVHVFHCKHSIADLAVDQHHARLLSAGVEPFHETNLHEVRLIVQGSGYKQGKQADIISHAKGMQHSRQIVQDFMTDKTICSLNYK